MDKNRLEAFSDGVLAIIITIMVLELKVPHGEDLPAVLALWPVAVSYVLSFLYVGIYWNNHHHLLKAAERVSGGILWRNLHLLFWLSLLPFTTGWMGENHFARWPVIFYGLNLLFSTIAYYSLETGLIGLHGPDSVLARALGLDAKGKVSPLLYLAGLAAACLDAPLIGLGFFAAVAVLWLVPDRRLEKVLAEVARSGA